MSTGMVLLIIGAVLLIVLIVVLWLMRPGSRWGLPPTFGG